MLRFWRVTKKQSSIMSLPIEPLPRWGTLFLFNWLWQSYWLQALEAQTSTVSWLSAQPSFIRWIIHTLVCGDGWYGDGWLRVWTWVYSQLPQWHRDSDPTSIHTTQYSCKSFAKDLKAKYGQMLSTIQQPAVLLHHWILFYSLLSEI